MSFFVMNKFGHNLDQYFANAKGMFTKKTIYQIGIRLVDMLKKIHETGFTYNDLKLENILIGNYKNSSSSLHQIRLCDFGFASRYMNKQTGEHYDQEETEVFKGNMIFSSTN